MAAIPYHVAYAFNRGEYARSGAFVSMGDTIYSYDMLLARRVDGEVTYAYQRLGKGGKAPSVTTARHMRALEAVV